MKIQIILWTVKLIHKRLCQANLKNVPVQHYAAIINTFHFHSHKCKLKSKPKIISFFHYYNSLLYNSCAHFWFSLTMCRWPKKPRLSSGFILMQRYSYRLGFWCTIFNTHGLVFTFYLQTLTHSCLDSMSLSGICSERVATANTVQGCYTARNQHEKRIHSVPRNREQATR